MMIREDGTYVWSHEMTVAEAIEDVIEPAIRAALHHAAYQRSFNGKRTVARQLTIDAHYWAMKREEEAADTAWRCVRFARDPITSAPEARHG